MKNRGLILFMIIGLGASVALGQEVQMQDGSLGPSADAAPEIAAPIPMPLDGSWICRDQVIGCCPAFFPDTYFWNSTDPVSFNITDAFVVTDAYNVYDLAVFQFATPLLPDWFALGLPGPFVSPPWTADPNVAWANPLFSKGMKTFAPGFHDISVEATQLPTGFADSTDCVRALRVPDCDIKPGSDPNAINPKSKGVIPVALLGSANVDVGGVDVLSLMFAGAFPAHDLTDPFTYLDHLQDVNFDGYTDLVSHYRTQETSIMAGDTVACISAEILGVPFVCCDDIKTPPSN